MFWMSQSDCPPVRVFPRHTSRPASGSRPPACGHWRKIPRLRRWCIRRRWRPVPWRGARPPARFPDAWSCRGAAHGHLVDLDGRDPDAYGHALPFLAADADAFVELKVVAHHADILQSLGTVADQRGALHRPSELAVL